MDDTQIRRGEETIAFQKLIATHKTKPTRGQCMWYKEVKQSRTPVETMVMHQKPTKKLSTI